MTAAYRLKGLGWFGGVVIVSLGFYLVSLQVAAERKRLAQVDAKIHSAQRDIRALEIEFDVRANLAQLERWNGDILALVAPTAGQFVRDEGALASISFDRAQPGSAAVQTAALVVPSLPAMPAPVTVAQVTGPSRSVVIDESPAVAPVRHASLVQVAAPAAAARPSIIKTVAVAAATPEMSIHKAKAVAMLDRTLLSDSTLGDLLSGARAETRRLH